LVDTTRTAFDETWTQPWGEVARVRDHHNELRVSVAEAATPGRPVRVVLRVFNERRRVPLRVPAQPGLQDFAITDELTEFALADDAGDGDPVEIRPRLDRWRMLYSSSPVSVIDSRADPLTSRPRTAARS